MRKLFFLIAIVAAALIASPPAATAQSVLPIGSSTDTAKANTTKLQNLFVGSQYSMTVQYNLHQLTDTVTGYVSIWGSLDNVNFAPWPGADSVAIVAHTDLNKLWFLTQPPTRNPIKYLQVRTRCPSNTTNSTSKAKLTTKIMTY